MRTWLVCKRCEVKEEFLPTTPIVGCRACGAPRFAENDDGQPMILWSEPSDPTKWGDDANQQELK